MKLFIKVKTRAKETNVEKINKNNFIVAVKEPPVKGKANRAVIKALAEFLKIRPSQIIIKSGAASRQKILEVLG